MFELIHPDARKVTNYGDLADLILIAVFDHRKVAYLDHHEVHRLGEAHGLNVVTELSPPGEDLGAQIDALRATWAGTDEEGTVLSLERPGEVVYRVKVKSPEYLQLMRLMAYCTYERTIEFLDARPYVQTWGDLEAALQEQGRDRVPEEVLVYYQQHWERFQRYLADLDRLRIWAEGVRDSIDTEVRAAGIEPPAYRGAFAERAKRLAYPGLVFAALDGRLDTAKMRKAIRDEDEARAAIAALGLD